MNGGDHTFAGGVFYAIEETVCRTVYDMLIAPTLTRVDAGANDSPASPDLLRNFPNPFNDCTTIRFTLPSAGRVEIALLTVDGRRAHSLALNGIAGEQTATIQAGGLASGVYLLILFDWSNFFAQNK